MSASLMCRLGGLGEPEWANRIFDLWRTVAATSMPEQVTPFPTGTRVRIGEHVDDSVLESLSAGWRATRRRPPVHVDFLPGVSRRPSNLFWRCGSANSRLLEETIALIATLVTVMKAHHAFVQTYEGPADRLDHIRWPDDGMASLYWWNYLGPVYVDLIGADVIERAPVYKVERFAEGYLLQLTAEPPQSVYDAGFLAARAAGMAALGRDLFAGTPAERRHLPDLDRFGLLNEDGSPFVRFDANIDRVPILEASVDRAAELLTHADSFPPFAVAMVPEGGLEVIEGVADASASKDRRTTLSRPCAG
jgi:hypothetical protein